MDKNNVPEALVSNTFKVKSKNGFEHLFTMRDSSVNDMIQKIETVEKAFLAKGWTPLTQQTFGKKEKPPVEYAEGRVCPNDGGRLIKAVTKTGKKFMKCENQKYDFTTKTTSGCTFTSWEE